MNRRIILWDQRKTSTASDAAGTTILKSTLPKAPALNCASYEFKSAEQSTTRVPSLVSYALKALLAYPEQVHTIGSTRLQYQTPCSPRSCDLLREVIPWYDPKDPNFSLSEVDPRLWVILAQLFSGLPDAFRTYRIPLSDQYIPLLQQIPSTPHFTLITILELAKCIEVTDETIIELKHLPGLCALDVSWTAVTAYGIQRLSRTLMWNELDDTRVAHRRGPWALRILDLRNCKNVDNEIFTSLPRFVLLTIVDVRGTKCNPTATNTHNFRPSATKALFYPSPLSTTLLRISAPTQSQIFSSREIFTLHITSLHHKEIGPRLMSSRSRPRSLVNMQDAYVVLPASQSYTKVNYGPGRPGPNPQRIVVGNSDALARNREAREEMEKHERNKDAWYERNKDILDDMDVHIRGYSERYNGGEESMGLGDYAPEFLSLPMNPLSHSAREKASTRSWLPSTTSRLAPSHLPGSSSRSSSSRGGLQQGRETSHHQEASRTNATGSVVFTISDTVPTLRQNNVLPTRQVPLPPSIERTNSCQATGSEALRPLSELSSNARSVIGDVSIPSLLNNSQVQTAQILAPSAQFSTSVNPAASRSLVKIPVAGLPPRLPMGLPTITLNDTPIAQAEAAGQVAAAFYNSPPAASTVGVNRQGSSGLRARVDRVVAGEVDLMLIRDPPPWSVLENLARPEVKAERKRAASLNVASLGQTSTKGAEGVNELMMMVKRRKMAKPSGTDGLTRHDTIPISRNPFRKKQDGGGNLSSRSSSMPTSGLTVEGGGTSKPLKPISKLVVPNLPEKKKVENHRNLQRPADKYTNTIQAKSINHTQTPIEVSIPKTHATSDTNVILKPPRADSDRLKQPIGSRKSASVRNATSDKIASAAFDWKGWGHK